MPQHESLQRRTFLRTCALAAVGLAAEAVGRPAQRLLATPSLRAGPDEPEIPNEIVRKALRDRFGHRKIQTGHVQLDMPAVAEDGRVVPVIIESDLPMSPDHYVKGVHLFVDHNPDVHVAGYYLSPSVGQVSITTRIKMKRSTWVRAIVETSTGQVWAGYANVRVMLNGCG